MRAALLLAVVSAVALATGVGLVYVPAGVITAGVEGLLAAYTWTYLAARSRERGRNR